MLWCQMLGAGCFGAGALVPGAIRPGRELLIISAAGTASSHLPPGVGSSPLRWCGGIRRNGRGGCDAARLLAAVRRSSLRDWRGTVRRLRHALDSWPLGCRRRRQRRRDSLSTRYRPDRGRRERIVLQRRRTDRIKQRDLQRRYAAPFLRPLRNEARGPADRRTVGWSLRACSWRAVSVPGPASGGAGGGVRGSAFDRRAVAHSRQELKGRGGLAVHRPSERTRRVGRDPARRWRHRGTDRPLSGREIRPESFFGPAAGVD